MMQLNSLPLSGPETSNNAACSGALIPLLTIGFPANVVIAVIMAAFMLHGVQPGPLLMAEAAGIF
jgi:putative tricarboxylic transport membrane protein